MNIHQEHGSLTLPLAISKWQFFLTFGTREIAVWPCSNHCTGHLCVFILLLFCWLSWEGSCSRSFSGTSTVGRESDEARVHLEKKKSSLENGIIHQRAMKAWWQTAIIIKEGQGRFFRHYLRGNRELYSYWAMDVLALEITIGKKPWSQRMRSAFPFLIFLPLPVLSSR